MALGGGRLGMVVKKFVIGLVVMCFVVLGFFLIFPDVVFIFLTFVMVFLLPTLKVLDVDVVSGGGGTTWLHFTGLFWSLFGDFTGTFWSLWWDLLGVIVGRYGFFFKVVLGGMVWCGNGGYFSFSEDAMLWCNVVAVVTV